MSKSWGQTIAAIPRAELLSRARGAHEGRGDPGLRGRTGDKPLWPRTWGGFSCVAGRCTCPAVYRTTYRYVTGRAGRTSTAEKPACLEHGTKFAARHGLVLPAAEATAYEIIEAYQTGPLKWGDMRREPMYLPVDADKMA